MESSTPESKKLLLCAGFLMVNNTNYFMTQQQNLHALFPVHIHAAWTDEQLCELSENLRNWLLEPSSLTARLKKHCSVFEVEVLGQQVEICQPDEATDEVPAGQEVLVREVILHCDHRPYVFARSLLPLSSLTGAEKELANLGNQPLGQVIFNHPNLQRKSIQVAEFNRHSSVAHLARHYQLPVIHTMWGRRSVFVIDNKPLIVAEVFLPQSVAYMENVN
ncbi:chorismate--pyruvate lyase family protein [Thalassotalea insulae]|uniref:chorismate--pyruvate lyase family protein n=1 Tax=Thalassotalea insulae TaxID=2056778 RepID=UPI0024E14F56|nr:chorismate lyase [Thalassotalea insulae]